MVMGAVDGGSGSADGGGGRLMTRVCATAAMQLAPNVISRHKSVPRSFGLVPFPRAHRYTGITEREVILFRTR